MPAIPPSAPMDLRMPSAAVKIIAQRTNGLLCGPWRDRCVRGVDWRQADVSAGTFDWSKVYRRVMIPVGASSATLVIGLENASGAAWFDSVARQLDPLAAQAHECRGVVGRRREGGFSAGRTRSAASSRPGGKWPGATKANKSYGGSISSTNPERILIVEPPRSGGRDRRPPVGSGSAVPGAATGHGLRPGIPGASLRV